MAKPKLWLGLSAVSVAVLVLVLAAQKITTDKAGIINDALGLNQTKIDSIDSDEVEGSAYADANGSLSDDGCERMINDALKFCEETVEQGSVLFKNDGALPLTEDERNVTLFGRGSRNLFMRSGAGGAAPNPSLVVGLDKAFKDAGFHINQAVFKKYSKLTQSNMTSPGTNVEDSVSIYNDVKDTFSDYNDAAIVTFVRIGTENTDPGDGQLDIKQNERDLLKMIKDSGKFSKIIVLINSPLPMSMDWADDPQYGINAIVYVGVPGYYGAGGIPHVLTGKDADGNVINPSGHAVDTFATSASSSPAYVNFNRHANNNNTGDTEALAVYQEGVYVGYKYYETRYEDAVLGQGNASGSAGAGGKASWNYAEQMGYPFGFGLSYTTFEQKIISAQYNEENDTIDFQVEVKNTGDMDGKASVQLYVQQPYTQFDKDNGLGKPSIALMAYTKADVKQDETKVVDISVERYFLTTYDYVNEYPTTEAGKTGNVKGRYILEGGDYYFAVGNGAHEALNNIIHVKSPAASLVDHNGLAYAGNDEAVEKITIAEDTVKYATSHYTNDVEVKNQFDDADYNFIAKKNSKSEITYLNRQDWQGTWPTKITANPASTADANMRNYYSTSASDKGYKAADGAEYNVPYIDPDTEEESVIKFSEMNKVPLEGEVTDPESRFYGQEGAEIWDKFIKQMNLNDLIISVTDNRGILDVEKVKKKGNSVAEGPEGLLSRYLYHDKRWATGFPTGPSYTGTWDHEMQAKFGAFYGEDALFCGVACVNAPGCNINRTPYGSRASEYMSEDGILNYNTAANIVGAARKKGLIMNIKHCFLNNQETARQGIFTYCNEQAIREIYLKPFEGALTKGKSLGIMTSYNRIGARYAACHEPLMMNVMRGEWKYRGQIIDDALTGSNDSQYSNGPAMLHCGTDLFCLDGSRGSDLRSYVTSNDDLTILKDLQRANKYIMYSISRSMMGGIEFNDFGKKAWQKAIDVSVVAMFVVTGGLVAAYATFEILAKVKGSKGKDGAEAPAEAE